jgi:integrase/recombinase XerC
MKNTADIQEAGTMEAIAIRANDQGLQLHDKAVALVEAFLAGRNERTIEAYRRDLLDFQAFTGADSPQEAANLLLAGGHGEANALALGYKASLINKCLSPATINRRLAALRSLVKMARTLGLVPWTLEVENMKAKAYRDTRGPGNDGVRNLLDQVEGSSPKAARDRALVHLLYDLGLRRGEVVALDLEDLDLERKAVSVMGKGRVEKELLTLPDSTCNALALWLEARAADPGPLFTNLDHAGKGSRLTGTSLYRIVRDLGAKAGIKTWPHGLRHTAITQAVKKCQEAGYPLEVAQDFSRHADIRTLMVYRDRERNYQGEIASLVAGTL